MTAAPYVKLPPAMDLAITHLRGTNTWIREHLCSSMPASEEDIRKLHEYSLELERKLDELRVHALSFKYLHDPAAAGWQETLYREHFIAAIRHAREIHGLGLREAKDLVEAFRDKKYAFASTAS